MPPAARRRRRRDAVTPAGLPLRPPGPLGVLIGHYTDRAGATGCTVVLCPGGAVGGVSVRGGAPCTRETDIFRPGAGVDPRRVHGVLLTGGSVFGLAACDGVVRYLSERGIGLPTAHACIPIVAAAGLYDLSVGDPLARPNADAGYAACVDARGGDVAEGAVGAGTGATVGKALGIEHCMPGGIGIARVEAGPGCSVQAVMAVNAFGEVVDPSSGVIVAGVRAPGASHIQPIDALLAVGNATPLPLHNTTIGVVVTDASLTTEEANELASVAHDGLARTIRPVHTRADGDTLFVLSTGSGPRTGLAMLDVIALHHAATRAVAQAVLRGVPRASGTRRTASRAQRR
jgi:L-aminopeptidase/D-esterase-like protein